MVVSCNEDSTGKVVGVKLREVPGVPAFGVGNLMESWVLFSEILLAKKGV